MSDEKWVPITNYEGFYEVSNLGRVRSVDRTIVDSLNRTRRLKGVMLVLKDHNHNMNACLKRDGRASGRKHGLQVSVGILVLNAFDEFPSFGRLAVHKDGNYSNNVLWNLMWGSQKDIIRNRGKKTEA